MAVYLMGVHLTGLHLMGVHLMGVHLIGVYLMGVHFMTSRSIFTPKALLSSMMTNGPIRPQAFCTSGRLLPRA